MEVASLAFLAFDPDAAAHEFDQPAGNGQSQAGAAVSARHRTVGLDKLLEYVPQPVPRNAHAGILDHEI